MGQQIKPNETHLCHSLERLLRATAPCQLQVWTVELADPSLHEEDGRTSQTDALRLGDGEIRDQIRGWATDTSVRGLGCLCSRGTQELEELVFSTFCHCWNCELYPFSVSFPEFNNFSTSCLHVSDLFMPPGSSHMTDDWGKKQRVHVSWAYEFIHTLTAHLGLGWTLHFMRSTDRMAQYSVNLSHYQKTIPTLTSGLKVVLENCGCSAREAVLPSYVEEFRSPDRASWVDLSKTEYLGRNSIKVRAPRCRDLFQDPEPWHNVTGCPKKSWTMLPGRWLPQSQTD